MTKFGRTVVGRCYSLMPFVYYAGIFESAQDVQETHCKYTERLVLVPRAGLEPARPILSNPRILSPALIFSIYSRSLSYSESFKKTGLVVDERHLPAVTNDYQLRHFKKLKLFTRKCG